MNPSAEFSHRTRTAALQRMRNETFDLLVIGGGITGAATARDAASRGLSVALVEARDFAWGTSSRSSKLIHGGLRYLQNMELGLVFESLSERSFLLKTVPHMVRPLPFYMPVYRGDRPKKFILNLGLWLYDLLALGRMPSFHKTYSAKKFLEAIPFLKKDGLKGGFRYYDASMWDDVLAVETLREAARLGAAIASYTEAVAPVWEKERITGFQIRDKATGETSEPFTVKARQVVVCAGPWTDQVGANLSPRWKPWLNPSKGVHLLFDLKKIPVPGAMVMNHPEDGRISFIIPRPDFGAGVVIVGTTDGPTPLEPEKAKIDPDDVHYLMDLLQRYFPNLKLTSADILSAYVGVRPLMGAQSSTTGSEMTAKVSAEDLQKVSREHYIGHGPGRVVIAAGGKYTTHRLMAREIVDVALKTWKEDAAQGAPAFPAKVGPSQTDVPVNPHATLAALRKSREEAVSLGWTIPEALWTRYGAEALDIMKIHQESQKSNTINDLEGFPCLEAQLRYEIRHGMVIKLEDFYVRRTSLFASRRDHGLSWAERLAQVWAQEMGLPETRISQEVKSLHDEVKSRESWRDSVAGS